MKLFFLLGVAFVALWAMGFGAHNEALAQIRLAPQPSPVPQYSGRYGLGTDADPELIAKLDVDVMADGRGLPRGSGTVYGGKFVYREHCAQCHGDDLRGIGGIRGGPLIGGRRSLSGATPLKTVESFWPYATTLMDYVRRAMPATSPGSLGPRDLYGVVAFILFRGGIIGAEETMTPSTLQLVQMPNRDGFTNAQGIIETFNWR